MNLVQKLESSLVENPNFLSTFIEKTIFPILTQDCQNQADEEKNNSLLANTLEVNESITKLLQDNGCQNAADAP